MISLLCNAGEITENDFPIFKVIRTHHYFKFSRSLNPYNYHNSTKILQQDGHFNELFSLHVQMLYKCVKQLFGLKDKYTETI